MLKTQITGAKYLSPQTNQMTNLNIAIPADSKDTKFGTSDILLAKDVAAYYYTKEETDNLILIAKNSAINIHDEDNTKSIKLDINDAEAADNYGSPVHVSLTDHNNDGTIDINAVDGFRHTDSNGDYSNLYSSGLDIFGDDEIYSNQIYSNLIRMSNLASSIEINTNKELTEEEQNSGYSPVNILLTDGNNKATINALRGFTHKAEDGFKAVLNSEGMQAEVPSDTNSIYAQYAAIYMYYRYNDDIYFAIDTDEDITDHRLHPYITLGPDNSFKISRPNDTEGGVISGIKSLTAFSNPSATKVWATDGSTVDLSTKANTSDVLLKKSASGGYYIESNSNELGWGAFAANMLCTASGSSSFAEGCITKALGPYAHAEGYDTTANGTSTHAEGESTQATQPGAHAEGYHTKASTTGSHAEGYYTVSNGLNSHAEGNYTEAAGFAEHALGTYNVVNKNAIHSVGIGNNTTRKNAEYIYAKNNKYSTSLVNDPKNGYKYLIGIGGYDGISTDNTTYKSVQEVIADLTARIEQLETKVRALEAANTPA